METTIGNKVMDLLTRGELREEIRDAHIRAEATERERLSGVKYMRIKVPVNPTAVNATIPGPESGYFWEIEIVSAVLSASDSLAIYAGDGTSGALIGYGAATTGTGAQKLIVVSFSSHSALLFAGESLYVATSGTGNISQVIVCAVQIPGELSGKVLT